MKKSEVAEKVKEVVIYHLGLREDQYREKDDFVDDMGADSLDTIELVMLMEEEFGILINDEEAEPIRTPQQAIDALCKRLSV